VNELVRSRCTIALEKPMTPRALAARIEELPPDARAEVEDFIDFVAARAARNTTASDESGTSLVDRLRARRERLLRQHGLYDTLPIIRELREHGR
jgi:hypothetical protein